MLTVELLDAVGHVVLHCNKLIRFQGGSNTERA
jgi:hypothetical protein